MVKKKNGIMKREKKDVEAGYKLDKKLRKENMATPKLKKPTRGKENLRQEGKDEHSEKEYEGKGMKHGKREHHKKLDPKTKTKSKMKKVMKEFKEGKLHSGSKSGPEVTNPRQAVAIAYSEAKKAKKKHKKKK